MWSVWFYISKPKRTLILTLVLKINFIKTGILGVSSSPEALGSTVRSRIIRENHICMFNSSLLKLCLGTVPSTSPSACSALEASSLPLEHCWSPLIPTLESFLKKKKFPKLKSDSCYKYLINNLDFVIWLSLFMSPGIKFKKKIEMILVINEVYLSQLGTGGARNSWEREPQDGLRTLNWFGKDSCPLLSAQICSGTTSSSSVIKSAFHPHCTMPPHLIIAIKHLSKNSFCQHTLEHSVLRSPSELLSW